MKINLSVLKKSVSAASGVSVFSIVRNEMYFMPHFLRHYRRLGVRSFLFLDDRSTDGTRNFLLNQADCGVIESNLGFGDLVKGERFGLAAKTIVPHALLQGRWVLTLDADEFLQIPQAFATLDELVHQMEQAGLKAARALMLDFFPASLATITGASADLDPFSHCPFFDVYRTVNWPDGTKRPAQFSMDDGVRVRMISRLLETSPEMQDLWQTYKLATMSKIPLLFWDSKTRAAGSHSANIAPSDRIQLVLAHFKFFPGYQDRIADALTTKAYWQNSTEYRFLDIAARELVDRPLIGSQSRRFSSAADLETTGLLFSHLTEMK